MPPARGVVTAAIALGANLGDRAVALRSAIQALRALPHTRLIAASDPIETAAYAPPEALAAGVDPGGPYLNAAALLETSLRPRELLAHLLRIEREHGRDRSAAAGQGRWSARTLDLDLLLYGDQIIDDPPDLVVPHPRMHQRLFVLEPLAAIAPDILVPATGGPGGPVEAGGGRTVRELRDQLRVQARTEGAGGR